MLSAARDTFCRHCLVLLPTDWKGDREDMYCDTCRALDLTSTEPSATCGACGATTVRPRKGRFFFTCDSCNRHVERLDGSEGSVRTGLKTRRVEISNAASELKIVYRWHRLPGIAFLFAGLVGVSMGSLFPLGMMFASVTAMLSAFVGVVLTIGLLYSGVANILNSTEVEGREGSLTVRIGPLPWKKDRTMRASDIRRVYTELVWRNHSRRGPESKTYDVVAELESGERETLLYWLHRREDAFAASDALRSWVEWHAPHNW